MSQYWASMDGSHPSDDPEPHRHVVTLDWFRTELDVAYAFLPGWDVALSVPFDVKRQRVRFERPDGTAFDHSEGEIHHRSETLEGVADLRLTVNYRPGGVLFEHDRLHLGVGISIPTGKIEDDPFKLGALGLAHTHIQFGTGTVDPVLRFGYSIDPDWWGFDLSLGAIIPFYDNRKTYQAPTVFDYSIGPRFRITEWLGLSVHYTGVYQGRGYWDGQADENTGYFLQGVSFAAAVPVSPAVEIRASALYAFSIETRGDADTFEMDWMLGISLVVNLGAGERLRPSLFRPARRE